MRKRRTESSTAASSSEIPGEPQRALGRTVRLEQLLSLGGLERENGRETVDHVFVGEIRGRQLPTGRDGEEGSFELLASLVE